MNNFETTILCPKCGKVTRLVDVTEQEAWYRCPNCNKLINVW